MSNITNLLSDTRPIPPTWIQGGSNRPVRLDDPQWLWVVRRGYFDVFAALDESSGGRRHHLFRAESGAVLFGAKSTDSGYGLLAVGSIESALECLPFDAAVDVGSIENWINRLSQIAVEPAVGWPEEIAAPGRKTLPAGQRLTADPQHLQWVEVATGAVRFLGRSAIEPPGRIPMTGRSWIEGKDEGATLTVTRGGIIDIRDVSNFNRIALDAATDRIQYQIHHDLRVNAASRGTNRQNFDTALRDLAGAARTRRGMVRTASGGDPLSTALGVLFQELQITHPALNASLTALAARAAGASPREWLDQISHELQIGRRALILRPNWWRSEGPAMLGWRGEDRKPVALVYRGLRGWEAFDSDGSRLVNGTEAAQLAPDGVQFYPPLPAQPLSFGDLFRFGSANIRPDLMRLLGMSLLVAILAVTIPIGSHFLVDLVIPDGDVPNLGIIIAALVAAAIASAAFDVVKGTALVRAESRLESRLQPGVIQRMIRLPTRFFRAHAVGDIADRALGIQSARAILSGSMVGGVLSGIFGMVSLVPMFIYQGMVAFVGLGLVLLIALTVAGLSYGQLRHERLRLLHQGQLDGFVLQMLLGIAKLRVAAAEPRAMAQWTRYFIAQRDRFVSAQWWMAGQKTVMSALPTFATAAIYAALAYEIKEALTQQAVDPTAPAPFSAADFVAFSTAFAQVMAALTGAAKSLTQMLVAVPLIERAKPLLETPVEVRDQAVQPGSLTGRIELKHVKFRYSADGPLVLDDVSFQIEPRQFVAIVGPSGSGKSTIIRLLLGFEPPDVGDILFDGKSVERLDLAAVRRQIGVVLQHGRISSGSIFSNISAGARLTLDDAWALARMVGLEQDIHSMPMGMHTVVLDGGGTLSGGQRQRILIARSLARQPRILLLDEASSALDNRTQAVVTETLGKLSITRIVIAHRLSTIQSVDRIVVIDRGRVVETGRYDELMAAGGSFAALAKRQLL